MHILHDVFMLAIDQSCESERKTEAHEPPEILHQVSQMITWKCAKQIFYTTSMYRNIFSDPIVQSIPQRNFLFGNLDSSNDVR